MQRLLNVGNTTCPGSKSEPLYEKENTYSNSVIPLYGKRRERLIGILLFIIQKVLNGQQSLQRKRKGS